MFNGDFSIFYGQNTSLKKFYISAGAIELRYRDRKLSLGLCNFAGLCRDAAGVLRVRIEGNRLLHFVATYIHSGNMERMCTR
ncbi:hypothetical protein D3C81_1870260 [compost metagenome]